MRWLKPIIVLWKTWELHGIVLFTFFIYFLLFFLAPFRKNTACGFLGIVVWLAYQLSGTFMSHTLALIQSTRSAHDGTAYHDLYTLWAVSMMVCFGGPDTITALSTEDSDLWLRSYLQFASHLVNILNAVLATPPDQRLPRPLLIMSIIFFFVAGLVKSAERLFSLMYSNRGHFRRSLLPPKPQPGPDYAHTMRLYASYQTAEIPVRFDEIVESPGAENVVSVSNSLAAAISVEANTSMVLRDIQVVKEAWRFYEKFKAMYVGQIFSCRDREETRDYFLSLSSESTFGILEKQMKFAYQGFFTKISLFPHRPWGLLRCLSIFLVGLVPCCLVPVYKDGFRSPELYVTFFLAAGIMFTDVIAVAGFFLSDMATCGLGDHEALSLMFYARRCRWGGAENPDTSYFMRALHTMLSIFFRQWSESISQFNILSYSIGESLDGCSSFYDTIGAKHAIDGWKYVSSKWLSKDLRDFIFDELKYKSTMATSLNIASEISSSRGDWILRRNVDSATFEPWINGVQYGESVLMWHIATELCYEAQGEVPDETRLRELSKTLSDYMLYLLIRQPKITSEVAPTSEVVFKDTYKELKEFFRRDSAQRNHKEACRRTMDLRARIPTDYVQEEGNNSVLLKACDLAQVLNARPRQWELISKVWVELLCYAASQSPAEVHAAQLAKGGELVTLVRLLMLHFGISNQFQQARGCGVSRKKLTIDEPSTVSL